MAKKPLTPEQAEIKAMKKVKSSENWIKFWAILLAAVLTVAVVFMGKTAAEDAIAKATGAQTEEGGDVNAPSGDTNTPSGDTNTPSGDTNAPSGDTNTPSTPNTPNTPNTPDAPVDNSAKEKEEFVKTINSVTAAAAKGSYSFERTGKFIKSVDVGSATSVLNGVVEQLAPGSNVDTIVGGFLGIKAEPITGVVTNGKGEGFDGVYMLKAMNITADDVTSYSKDGNKYTFTIKQTVTPTANSPLGRATNDYVTFEKVNEALKKDAAGMVSVEAAKSSSTYDNIKFTATIVDGKLTNLEYSYTFSANLSLKITFVPANGTGEAEVTNKYTNIKY